MREKATTNNPATVDKRLVEDLKEFLYLCRKMTHGDHNQILKARASKANQAFLVINPTWRFPGLRIHTKISFFLCRSKRRKTTVQSNEIWRFSTVHSQDGLGKHRTRLSTMMKTLQARRWPRVGHVCCMPTHSYNGHLGQRETQDDQERRGRKPWRAT